MEMLNTLVLPWLEAAGAGPNDVTHVVHTHLHTDHVGWNTVLQDGKWVPTFPKARHVMPKAEYDWWRAEYDKGGTVVQAGSFADSVLPVLEAGMVDFINPGEEAAGCLVAEDVAGHAPGLTAYRLRSDGEEGLFSTDTMHSPIQIANPHWNDRYVLWADKAKQARAGLLKRAAEREALIMPMHYGAPYCGYVRRQGEGYVFEPAG
jgi:glyoxylase-like metal-dependent hydrolase (beta-lactamase superfamily II)